MTKLTLQHHALMSTHKTMKGSALLPHFPLGQSCQSWVSPVPLTIASNIARPETPTTLLAKAR